MLINCLLMACGRRHFEVRQRLEAPECCHHLSISNWPEVCRPRTKACKQVWGKNDSRTTRHYFVKITSWMIYNVISLNQRNFTRGRWFKMAQKLMLERNYNSRQSRDHPQAVRAFAFSPSRLRIWLPVQP